MNKLHELTKDYLKSDLPEFDSGDTVSVSVLVREGNKERIQKYEGVVISKKGGKGIIEVNYAKDFFEKNQILFFDHFS